MPPTEPQAFIWWAVTILALWGIGRFVRQIEQSTRQLTTDVDRIGQNTRQLTADVLRLTERVDELEQRGKRWKR